jgi:hypothetical protein
MDQKLTRLEPKPKWLNEADIKTKLGSGARLTFKELRPLADPKITDYYLNRWIKESPGYIELKRQSKPRERNKPPKPPSNAVMIWSLRAMGGTAGAIGLGLNFYYAWNFGGTWEQSAINAATGSFIDTISILGLMWACALPTWHRRSAIAVWALAVLYSFMVAVGFFSTLLGDHVRRGEHTDQYRADLTAQIEQASAELNRLGDPKKLDDEIQAEINRLYFTREWTQSDGCTKSTRSDWACITLKQLREKKDREAKDRVPLTDKIERLSAARHALSNESSKDMLGEIAETIAGPTGAQIVNLFRRIAPALLLALSGLLLAYARELAKGLAARR